MEKKKNKKVPCEVYSRIVGYLRPVQNWNEGKRQEFEDRQTYQIKAASGK
jgi:anaerobic ribonucleoside-triphosphate reductase